MSKKQNNLLKIFDPLNLTLIFTRLEIPIIQQLFGVGLRLSKINDPDHKKILDEVDIWRGNWIKNRGGLESDFLVASALAAAKCQEEIVAKKFGRKTLWFVRIFYFFAILLSLILIAGHTLRNLFLIRKPSSNKSKLVCFFPNQCVESVASHLFPEKDLYRITKTEYFLSRESFLFILSIFLNYPIAITKPRLLSNLVRLLAKYSFIIRYHNPKIIIGHFEGSSSISILTLFLRRKGIAHYSVMHGEIFFTSNIGSFAVLDKFLVWGKHYKDVSVRKKHPEQNIQILPPRYLKDYFKYFRKLCQPREPKLLLLHEPYLEKCPFVRSALLHLLNAVNDTFELRIRHHPAFGGNINQFVGELKKCLPTDSSNVKISAESPFEISARDSLLQSRVVVSANSTMMVEGWVLGCKCIYLSYEYCGELLEDRYSKSPNVLIISGQTPISEIRNFIVSPAELNVEEDVRVSNVIAVDL